MNILIITTIYPPDSAIAAVRPYMFAKNLTEAGEKVTVLRSGVFELSPFDEYPPCRETEVISAFGRNCPAEKYKRGEYEGFEPRPLSSLHFLPRRIRIPLKAVRDGVRVLRGTPPKYVKPLGISLTYQKRTIDRMYDMGRSYDIVFSTCGDLENIYAGKYAAEKFGAKWIMDFRDSMIRKEKIFEDIWLNIYGRDATLCALKNADMITAVSEGLVDELRDMRADSRIRVLYNGFDDKETIPEITPDKDTLSFCYTGRLYEDQHSVLGVLASVFAELIKVGRLERSRIRFNYAGSSSKDFSKIFSDAGISDILVDHGYLSKKDTFGLQLSSDIFSALAWNTRKTRGMLSGKFYEGIKAGKPILALVSGNEPNSELMQLQRKYGYGFCYENADRKNLMPALAEYIAGLYNEKMQNGRLAYVPSKELYDAFAYSELSKRLHNIMLELTNENDK